MNSLLEAALSNAAVATLLAVAAAVFSRIAKRPAVAHLLWILVLLKLVTPPFVGVPVPLPDTANFRQTADVPIEPNASATPAWQVAGAESALPLDLEAVRGEASLSDQPGRAEVAVAEPSLMENPGSRPTPLIATATEWLLALKWLLPLCVPALLSVWALGAVAFLMVAAGRIVRFHRLLRYGRPAPREVCERVNRLAGRLGLVRSPEVLLVPGCISPLVWAVAGRARIILPERLLERLSSQQQDTLLAHELAHVCRYDHWVRWLELVAGSLFWWHPVVWWARRQLESLEEQCCDAWVVWALPQAARDYARALVETVDFLSGAKPALPPVASGLGYVHHLKRRLTMIVREPLYHRLSLPAAVAVILLAMLILPAGPHRLAAETPATPVVAAVPEDPPDDEDRPPSRDLDRRLRRLENQMDRVLRALESRERRGERSSSDEPKKRDQEAGDRAKEAAERAAKRAEEIRGRVMRQAEEARKRGLEMAERARKQADEARERALKQAREAVERAREAVKESTGKDDGEKTKDKTKDKRKEFKFRFDKDGVFHKDGVDSDQIKELQRKIEESVRQAVNPEKIKEMERTIRESVNKNLSPERMEAMQKQIEQAVQQAVNPKRMEEMAKRIEATVRRSLEAQEREEVRRRERHGPSGSAGQPPTPPSGPKPPTAAGARASRRARTSGDVEERLNKLEEKMDRLLDALKSREQSK
jgi:beta-lactamase regulating signal transducer with metallopeptidase domain